VRYEEVILFMDNGSISRASAAHAARLDRTVADLQHRVKEQEAALEKVYSDDNGYHNQLTPT
jgi:hypothetical protein